MDRKKIKQNARESLRDSGSGPKKVTLIFLVCAVVIQVLKFALVYLLENINTGGNYLSDTLASGAMSMGLSYAVSILLQVLFVVLCAGYGSVALELRCRNAVKADMLLGGARMGLKIILLYVLMMLFISLWTYVLSVPLSYLLIMDAMMEAPMLSEKMVMVVLTVYIGIVMFLMSYRYRMAFFMLLENPEITPRQALRRASAINKGHRFKLLVMDLSFVPWLVLCVLTCGVLLVWKLPYMVTAYAHAYDALMEDYARRQQKYMAMREQMLNDRHTES